MGMFRAFAPAAIVIAFVSQPALAAGETSRPVSYKDLDLSRGSDRERLDRRLESAARGVCGAQKRLLNFAETHCVRTVLLNTQRDVRLAVRKAESGYAGGGPRESESAEQ